MPILARRLIIITLISATFAVLFAALVTQPSHRALKFDTFVSATCPSALDCRVSL